MREIPALGAEAELTDHAVAVYSTKSGALDQAPCDPTETASPTTATARRFVQHPSAGITVNYYRHEPKETPPGSTWRSLLGISIITEKYRGMTFGWITNVSNMHHQAPLQPIVKNQGQEGTMTELPTLQAIQVEDPRHASGPRGRIASPFRSIFTDRKGDK
ncbi:hypothetical protein ACFQ6N_00685 [Kitasatospora sp. NPDC056446]|uniref:hypothetical protein n=1 Tax=Kitasatospora sp. NPDC056446 TaxID=3345819 RepID=UPI00367F111F